MNEQIETLFVPYVLGLLTANERRQVDHYVGRNPEAEARLAQLLEERLEDIGDEIEPVTPAPAVREALLTRVITDRSTTVAPAQPTLRARINARFSLLVTTLAVLGALLLIAGGAWVSSLNQRLAQQDADRDALAAEVDALRGSVQSLETENSALLARGNELAETVAALESDRASLLAQLNGQADVVNLLSSPTVQTVAVAGTEAQPSASGQLVLDPESGVALLVVSNMAPLAEDLAYQVLLITATGHTTHETFRVNAQGENVLVLHPGQSLLDYDQIGISIEPAGGSRQRTGDIVMLAPLPSN